MVDLFVFSYVCLCKIMCFLFLLILYGGMQVLTSCRLSVFELNVVLLLTGNRVSFRGGKMSNVYYDCRVSCKGGQEEAFAVPPLVKFSK